MPKLVQPSCAASNAIHKAHKALEKVKLRVTESLVHDLQGTGTRAEGMLTLDIRIFDKKSERQISDALKVRMITVLRDSGPTQPD